MNTFGIILSIYCLISTSYARESYLVTLNEAKNSYLLLPSALHVNLTCVDEKLKITEMGEKQGPDFIGREAVDYASALCLKDKTKKFDTQFSSLIKVAQSEIARNYEICFKLKFQEIDPNDELLAGFEVTEDEIKNCKENYEVYENSLPEFQTSEITDDCGFSVEQTKKHNRAIFKLVIVLMTENQNSELLITAKENCYAVFEERGEKVVQCALKELEKFNSLILKYQEEQ